MNRSKTVECSTCKKQASIYIELQDFFIQRVRDEDDDSSNMNLMKTYNQCLKCLIGNSNPFYELIWFLEAPTVLDSSLTNNIISSKAMSKEELFWPFPVQL
jgi:hypothetical protein